MFEDVVYDILRENGPSLRQDILTMVKALKPDSCTGDWEHDVDNALQVLKNGRGGLITFSLAPGQAMQYLWRVVGQ